MDRVYIKQMNKISQKEKSFLTAKGNSVIKARFSPLMVKIQDKIPENLNSTLETAFYKSFKLAFEKGYKYIEKTYNKENKKLEFEINDYAVDKKFCDLSIRKLDRPSLYSNVLNTSFSVLEGGVLGVLGIGLPDIPIFISLILKTIHEVALSYGFDYNTAGEKAYVLLLIEGALSKDDRKIEVNKKLDALSDEMDHQAPSNIDLDEYMKSAAKVLSDTLLAAKFIQGIPLVGIVGGAVNFNVLQKIGRFSKLKYKKRYLVKKFENKE